MPDGGGTGARRLGRFAWPAGTVLALLLSLGQVGREHPGTDFHVFWEAGRDFAAGLPLYERAEGARRFIYPPFAAMAFQPLGLLSLDAAAVAFHALSLLLLAASAVATWRIAEAWAPGRRRGALPMLLAVLAVAHIVQSNLARNQTNLLVLALCLAGVLAAARGRRPAAAAWLSAATLLKLTPVFAWAWFALRGGRRAAWWGVAALALLLALPLLQRGPVRGLRDYAEYGETFLAEFARGGVRARPANQSLAATIERSFVPGAGGPGLDHAWLPGGAPAARTVRLGLSALLGLVFLASLGLLRHLRRPPGLFEVATAFLLGLLLSGITWKAHFVPLLFVAYAVFSLPRERWAPAGRRALGGLAALVLVSGLGGRDVLGPARYEALFGYGGYTWLALVLFAAAVALSHAPPERLGGTGPADRRTAGPLL